MILSVYVSVIQNELLTRGNKYLKGYPATQSFYKITKADLVEKEKSKREMILSPSNKILRPTCIRPSLCASFSRRRYKVTILMDGQKGQKQYVWVRIFCTAIQSGRAPFYLLGGVLSVEF